MGLGLLTFRLGNTAGTSPEPDPKSGGGTVEFVLFLRGVARARTEGRKNNTHTISKGEQTTHEDAGGGSGIFVARWRHLQGVSRGQALDGPNPKFEGLTISKRKCDK